MKVYIVPASNNNLETIRKFFDMKNHGSIRGLAVFDNYGRSKDVVDVITDAGHARCDRLPFNELFKAKQVSSERVGLVGPIEQVKIMKEHGSNGLLFLVSEDHENDRLLLSKILTDGVDTIEVYGGVPQPHES